MAFDDDDLTPEEIAEIVLDSLEDAEEEVPPTPWLNHDTTAASMLFAANISLAAADLFRNLASFALGQSAHDWNEMDKKQFIDDSMSSIMRLPEQKGD